jgi:predicted metal-binding membrane protein
LLFETGSRYTDFKPEFHLSWRAITVGVLAEKIMPWGGGLARLAGAGLIAWGLASLAVALL